jgi:NAD(P)-dependent dehydrogenase (short-subunit alcohol dehydrogenase family)
LKVDLTGKTALVTGASSGLGHHFAQTLARSGAVVAAAARRTDKIEELVTGLQRAGHHAHALAIDVTKPQSAAACVEQAVGLMGGIDILVNNAGIAVTKAALECDENDWQSVIDTNLSGAWYVAQAVARSMVATKRRGSIINIASVLGLRVATHLPAYAAAKAGLIHLTQALALEWARYQIRVNAIAPGIHSHRHQSRIFCHRSRAGGYQARPATPYRRTRRSRRRAAAAGIGCVELHDREHRRCRWRSCGQFALIYWT